MNGDILFLAHRLPYPPDRGDKIRSHHILRRLARIAPVHVATFADSDTDWAHEPQLAEIAKTHCLVPRTKPLWRAGVEALWAGEPVSLAAFRDVRLAEYVRQTIANERIGMIYIYSGQMGQYLPPDFDGTVLVDLVDVDSAKFDAYGQRGRSPRAWIDAREGRLLRVEEERLAHHADRTFFVSEAETDLFRARLARPVGVHAVALRNGIDAAFFDPDESRGRPAGFEGAGPHLVFTGQMDYAPNIAAAERLMARLMPKLRRRYPDAQSHIVGRNPPSSLMQFDGRDGCRIWGEVPDVRPYVASADIVVVPLEIARGVQNKVLEAMAMARPVLLTEGAATGIGGEDGVHYIIANSDDEIVQRACACIDDPVRRRGIGRAARQFVIDSLGWEAVLAPLAALVEKSSKRSESRDAA
ncbi:putative glycosyltransferase [Caenibius tardaugens NBRC 16725]|uniref:Putative glycosyltransferase n=1 Tax=Caenibius tardaugens NBRC 16725 TaxID=1219035 RepID=U2ZZN0_9SPHN|nr:TIGR03087 family PEP-CTERM/XrtA system glycosyltransferase [Caenibius tardaugens]AZI38007.1 TIGR03087 family PEP-CTERM/XrtA system glycosyltransferase [Caenibius tardaugens NBRC 16725]GAD47983.1 putative glycosyltransferase [Caenibius tardaugens NBRC 16725]